MSRMELAGALQNVKWKMENFGKQLISWRAEFVKLVETFAAVDSFNEELRNVETCLL
jgi:hypothetical protein